MRGRDEGASPAEDSQGRGAHRTGLWGWDSPGSPQDPLEGTCVRVHGELGGSSPRGGGLPRCQGLG